MKQTYLSGGCTIPQAILRRVLLLGVCGGQSRLCVANLAYLTHFGLRLAAVSRQLVPMLMRSSCGPAAARPCSQLWMVCRLAALAHSMPAHGPVPACTRLAERTKLRFSAPGANGSRVGRVLQDLTYFGVLTYLGV